MLGNKYPRNPESAQEVSIRANRKSHQQSGSTPGSERIIMKVGIIGGGQLARMLAISGYPLGLDFVILEPAKDACSAHLGDHLCADYDDEEALAELAEKVDVVTYEFENVPASAVEFLNGKCPVYPPAQALACARDRLNEKNMFRELGIGTAEFADIDSLQSLEKGR